SLSPEGQRERYSKYACHELNLFLARKDPEFFAAVIQPYLANKRDKTFMDHYLLDADLHGYLELWAYAQLNALEKILLAERIADERGPGSRHINDAFDLLPPDVEGNNAAFDTALQGSALAEQGGLAMFGDGLGDAPADRRGGSGGGLPGAPPPPPPRMPPAMAAPASPSAAPARKRAARSRKSESKA